MISLLAILALLSLVQSVPTQVAAEDAGQRLSWTIYHSWNPNQQFVRRGSLTWGSPIEVEEGAKGDNTKKEFRIINDDASANMTGKDVREMLEYGWYHVKIQSRDDANNFVFQTVPACNLRRANFKDQFDVTLPRSSTGDRQDPMTSFAYTPLVSPLAPKNCEDYDRDGDGDDSAGARSFSSRVSVQLDTPAMAIKNILPASKPPPGIAFVKQPHQPGTGGSGQQRGDENYDDPNAPPPTPSPIGFFGKYWYIILPMVILQFLQAPEEFPPEPQQQQQQQQQQQGGNNNNGGGGGGTIAPQAAAGGSAQKVRRGKTNKRN